jgi:hypothetical protein
MVTDPDEDTVQRVTLTAYEKLQRAHDLAAWRRAVELLMAAVEGEVPDAT